uniref:Glutamine amidotransferase class 1 domain containing 3 n=1 Tax=Canis lupus familiaris TaxID=9615 RepID=A0A8C0PGT0_CANLF
MAAVRALGASRLRAASAFAPRAAFHGSAPRPGARVALVLSGCGVYDGTELQEAAAVLVHLSRGGAEVQTFAPDIPQMHVVDHTKGQPSESESRNVLTESARITRGKITDLARLSAANHDAAIFPGGFGAAKNLSTFAVDGKDCRVHEDVERVLKEFHKAGKPIGVLERGEGSAWSPPWEKLPRSPALPGAPRTAPWGCVSRVLLGQALCRSSLLVKVVAVGPAVRLVCSEETLRSRQGADDSGATCLSPPGMPSLERHPTWGLCCIASVLAAKVLHGVEVTVGHEQEEGGRWPYAGTAEAIKALGAKHCVKEVTEAHVDKKNKVVTTPAFMCETELHHVHDGIGAMVKKVLELCAK